MTKTSQESTPPIIVLSELYLARRTALELTRDAGEATRARLNEAFADEAITILLREGFDFEQECQRLSESGEEDMSAILSAYRPHYIKPRSPKLPYGLVGVPKSTVSSPATPSKT